MNTLDPTEIDFDSYFADHQDDGAKIKPASHFVAAVLDRFYGQTSEATWTPTGFRKLAGDFDLRPGELTIWAGINGHGKTTFLSHVMLNLIAYAQKRVCIASMEMKPVATMAKMAQQAAGVSKPSQAYVRKFHEWTDGYLWLYDHQGKLAASRALAVATYCRKELQVDHLVIDSLMKCGIGPEDYAAQKDFVDGLTAICRDTGLHIHLVAHMRKGENERVAPDKFSVKGASEIVDLTDNMVIIWKNMRKLDAPDGKRIDSDPDAYLRVGKQRHHAWEGSKAFWFDRGSQQFLETHADQPTYIDMDGVTQ